RPLRRLRLSAFTPSPASLGWLLDESARCELQSLTLSGCHLTADHARVIADSPRSSRLLDLEIGDWDFSPEAARILFASEHLRSVVSLTLGGSDGVAALARAEGWDRLRSLQLSWGHFTTAALELLLASPNVRNLTHLVVECGRGDTPPFTLTHAVVNRLATM